MKRKHESNGFQPTNLFGVRKDNRLSKTAIQPEILHTPYFARNGWRNYCVPGDTEILELCPACAVRALRRGETSGLADTWLRPTHAYTHAFREVDAQLSARERVVANLLLTEGRTA